MYGACRIACVAVTSLAGVLSIGWGNWGGSQLGLSDNRGATAAFLGSVAPAQTENSIVRDDGRAARRRTLRVTAYCDRGTTASGVRVDVGQCAAPADVPFGSRIWIPSINREFVVTDRTHARFRHNTVDIFMTDSATCFKFGRRYLECVILPPERNHAYGCRDLAAKAAAAAKSLLARR